ncbi:MAG: hypothetical protein KAR38_12010 [Calditrichia bacterium]|nr:hypothetical protein [Calditrichia bacterium]
MEDIKITRFIAPVVSFMAALILCYALYNLPINYGHDFLALLLSAISGVYFGAAVNEKKFRPIFIEFIIFLIMLISAFTGLYYFLLILGGGYLIHGIWSISHYFFRVGADVNKSFSLTFAIFDLVILLFVFIFLS